MSKMKKNNRRTPAVLRLALVLLVLSCAQLLLSGVAQAQTYHDEDIVYDYIYGWDAPGPTDDLGGRLTVNNQTGDAVAAPSTEFQAFLHAPMASQPPQITGYLYEYTVDATARPPTQFGIIQTFPKPTLLNPGVQAYFLDQTDTADARLVALVVTGDEFSPIRAIAAGDRLALEWRYPEAGAAGGVFKFYVNNTCVRTVSVAALPANSTYELRARFDTSSFTQVQRRVRALLFVP